MGGRKENANKEQKKEKSLEMETEKRSTNLCEADKKIRKFRTERKVPGDPNRKRRTKDNEQKDQSETGRRRTAESEKEKGKKRALHSSAGDEKSSLTICRKKWKGKF